MFQSFGRGRRNRSVWLRCIEFLEDRTLLSSVSGSLEEDHVHDEDCEHDHEHVPLSEQSGSGGALFSDTPQEVGNPNLAVSSAFLRDQNGNPIGNPILGQELAVQVWYTTQDLPSGSYQIKFEVDGVPLESGLTSNGTNNANGNWFWWRSGWYAEAGTHTVTITLDSDGAISEVNEGDNQISFNFTSVAVSNLPQKFTFPVAGVAFQDWTITNHVDLDPTPNSLRDYRGGVYTYDLNDYDHDALDITINGFSKMDDGTDVFAAASGTVSAIHDGEFDRNKGPLVNGGPVANSITIDHGNGWQTIYLHLRNGSINVSIGQSVTRGQKIGEVGSSGNSTGPHLHFGVRYNGRMVETLLDANNFWVSPPAYTGDVADVREIGTTSLIPTADEVDEEFTRMQTFSPNQRVVTWYRYHGLEAGDTRRIIYYRPNGTVYWSFDTTQTSTARNNWAYAYNNVNSTLGVWQVAVEFNGTEVARTSFVVANPGSPEIRVEEGTDFIVDGRSTPLDFGTINASQPVSTRTFMVSNQGHSTLTLSGITVPNGFQVIDGLPSSLAPGASDTLVIGLSGAHVGSFAGDVRIFSNDADESTFNFAVVGQAQLVTDDLYVWDQSSGYWVLGSSTGTRFQQQYGPRWSSAVAWNFYEGDFNGDGLTDVAGRTSGQWWIGLSNGTTIASTSYWGKWSATGWQNVLVGDFDDDGRDDIAGRNAAGEWWVAFSNGSSFSTSYVGRWASTGWANILVGDVDGDGADDIIGRRTSGEWWWQGFSRLSTMTMMYAGRWSGSAGWQDVLVGDFNGDNRADVAGRTSSGQWWIGSSNGSSFLTSYGGKWSTAVTWTDTQVADINGDGRDDIVSRNNFGDWWMLRSNPWNSVFLMHWTPTTAWRVAVGDFNGDGLDDIAGLLNGSWFVGVSTGQQSNTTYFGGAGAATNPGYITTGRLTS